jgi:hypothetical protein
VKLRSRTAASGVGKAGNRTSRLRSSSTCTCYQRVTQRADWVRCKTKDLNRKDREENPQRTRRRALKRAGEDQWTRSSITLGDCEDPETKPVDQLSSAYVA